MKHSKTRPHANELPAERKLDPLTRSPPRRNALSRASREAQGGVAGPRQLALLKALPMIKPRAAGLTTGRPGLPGA